MKKILFGLAFIGILLAFGCVNSNQGKMADAAQYLCNGAEMASYCTNTHCRIECSNQNIECQISPVDEPHTGAVSCVIIKK